LLHYSIFKNKKRAIENLQNIPFQEMEKMMKIANENLGVNIPLKNTDFVKINLPNKDSKEIESLKKMKDLEISEQHPKNLKEGIFIKNAGLILLHPFLKMFFEKLDFLSEKIIKPEKTDEAINVLHYLATGKEQAYEHELMFEKFICNVPFQQPINRHIVLSKNQKIACEVLLQAVLDHWTALKSDSTEIIQNEFLQREGKLI